MKLFPYNHYTIELQKSISFAMNELQNQTLSNEQFVADWNNQAFIGNVTDNEFQISVSKKLYGSIFIFIGKLENKKNVLSVHISKKAQIIFFILLMFPVLGFIISLFQNGFENSTKLIAPTILTILIFRFVFIEISFRIISNIGLKKLKKIIYAKQIIKT